MSTPFVIDLVAKQVLVKLPQEKFGNHGEWLTLRELHQLVRDIKNSVKAFAGLATHKLIKESKGLQAFFESDEFTKAVAGDDTVNDAAGVANGDSVVTGAAATLTGFFFNNGRYFLVVGQRVYSVNDLILHGALSDEDVNLAGYMMKYLKKSAEGVRQS